ncbi:hypothetical protein GCM10029978_066470 [Actinoallomurus acanthiterrae]
MGEDNAVFAVAYSTEVAKDIRELPTKRLQLIALYGIEGLIARRLKGTILGENPSSPGLGGARSLRFDNRPELVRYRIVYREVFNVFHIIALGPREDLEVYVRASERLGATPRRDIVESIQGLEKAARDSVIKAKAIESRARSLSARIEKNKGPRYLAALEKGSTAPELQLARAADREALVNLYAKAATWRKSASQLRAERQTLIPQQRHTSVIQPSLVCYVHRNRDDVQVTLYRGRP